MNHLLKIGDEVMVLEPLDRNTYGPGWVPYMDNYIGKKATVVEVGTKKDDRYRLNFETGRLDFWWEHSNLQLISDLLY